MNNSMMCGESAIGKVSVKPAKRTLSQILESKFVVKKGFIFWQVAYENRPIFKSLFRHKCDLMRVKLLTISFDSAILGAQSK